MMRVVGMINTIHNTEIKTEVQLKRTKLYGSM